MPVSLQGYAESTYFDFGNIFTHTKLAVDPVTQTFYAAQAGQSTLRQLTRDKTLSTVSTNVSLDNLFPFLGTDLQFYDGSVYMSVSNGKLIRFDPSSGTSTELTTLPGFNYEAGLDVFEGKLYISDGSGTANQIQQYDVATGTSATVLSGIPAETYSVEIHPVSGHLYFSEKTDTQIKFYVADLLNQTSRLIGSVNSTAFGDFAVDPSEQFFYFRNSVTVDQIAIADGTVNTFMTGLESSDFQDLTFAPASEGNGSSLYMLSGGKLLEVTATGNDFNYAPVLTGTAATTVKASSIYSFQPQVSDLDQDSLTFAIVNQPSWANFDAETGKLSGTPTADQVGFYSGIVISASDGRETTRLSAFDVQVEAMTTENPVSQSSGQQTNDQTNTQANVQTIARTTAVEESMVISPTASDTFGVPPAAINFKGGKSGLRTRGGMSAKQLKGNDVVLGDRRNDYLSGEAGNDRVFGMQGNDRLLGGAGNDQLDGGKGNDILEDSAGDDWIKGGVGKDTILAGAGSDVIVGGTGADLLTGGGGKDLIVYTNVSQGGDMMTDFSLLEDLIDLRQIFASPKLAGNSAIARFRQFVRLEQVGMDTVVKVDGDGSGKVFTPLVTLNNVTASTLMPKQFVIG
jgi:Ca2+-binding RTX toxin-like protein